MSITDIDKVIDIFGRWPAFHDAEVVRFTMDRRGDVPDDTPAIECTLHAFEPLVHGEVESDRRRVEYTRVDLQFLGVEESECSGFNSQNALWEMEILPASGDVSEEAPFTVHFKPSYGFGAWFECRAIVVTRVVPCYENGHETPA